MIEVKVRIRPTTHCVNCGANRPDLLSDVCPDGQRHDAGREVYYELHLTGPSPRSTTGQVAPPKHPGPSKGRAAIFNRGG